MKVLIGIGLVFMFFALSATAGDILYNVEDIKIEASAKNATVARREALNIGERKAYEELLKKILPEKTAFPKANLKTIRKLIKARQIKKEKISSLRYSGLVSFQFSKPRVNKFLMKRGVNLTETSSNTSLLVIPLLNTSEHSYLWEEENPWKKSWKNTSSKFVSLIVPTGDIEDIIIANKDDIAQERVENIRGLATKYGTQNILIAEANYYLEEITNVPYLEISMKYFDGINFKTEREIVRDGENKGFSWLIDDAVKQLTKKIDSKMKHVSVKVGKTNLTILVPIKNLDEWADIRKRLSSLSNVLTSVKLVAFTYGQADIRVVYRDTPEMLEQNFKKAGLKIAYENGYWILTKN